MTFEMYKVSQEIIKVLLDYLISLEEISNFTFKSLGVENEAGILQINLVKEWNSVYSLELFFNDRSVIYSGNYYSISECIRGFFRRLDSEEWLN